NAGSGRHAPRDLRTAGQCVCRGAAGLAGNQPAPDRRAAGERCAERSGKRRRAHRARRVDRGRRRPCGSRHGGAPGQREFPASQDERSSSSHTHTAGRAVASRPARATLAARASVLRCDGPDVGRNALGNGVNFDQRTTKEMIQAIADTVIDNVEELTELDRAIGDADHGVNLERGFKSVLAKIDTISERPINEALSEVGRTLILSVGGASGPLYGKLFATTGKLLSN